jgi:hypothetical protein
MCGLLDGDELEEGVDRSKARVSSADTIVSLRFQVIEKGSDKRRVDIREE